MKSGRSGEIQSEIPPLVTVEPLTRGSTDVLQSSTISCMEGRSYLLIWHPLANAPSPGVMMQNIPLEEATFDASVADVTMSLRPIGYVPIRSSWSVGPIERFNWMRISKGVLTLNQGAQGIHKSCVFGRAVAGAVSRPNLNVLTASDILMQTVDADRRINSAFSEYALHVNIEDDARLTLGPYAGPLWDGGYSFAPFKQRYRLTTPVLGGNALFASQYTYPNDPPLYLTVAGYSLTIRSILSPPIMVQDTVAYEVHVNCATAYNQCYYYAVAVYIGYGDAGEKQSYMKLLERYYVPAGTLLSVNSRYIVPTMNGYTIAGLMIVYFDIDTVAVSIDITDIQIDVLLPGSEFSESPAYVVLLQDTEAQQSVELTANYSIEGYLSDQSAIPYMHTAAPPTSFREWERKSSERQRSSGTRTSKA